MTCGASFVPAMSTAKLVSTVLPALSVARSVTVYALSASTFGAVPVSSPVAASNASQLGRPGA